MEHPGNMSDLCFSEVVVNEHRVNEDNVCLTRFIQILTGSAIIGIQILFNLSALVVPVTE